MTFALARYLLSHRDFIIMIRSNHFCYQWIPPGAARLDCKAVESSQSEETRSEIIARWSEEGGVLLFSYDLFRQSISNAHAGGDGTSTRSSRGQVIQAWHRKDGSKICHA